MKRKKIAARIVAFTLATSLITIDALPAFAAAIPEVPAEDRLQVMEESFADEAIDSTEEEEVENFAGTEMVEESELESKTGMSDESETELEPEMPDGSETESKLESPDESGAAGAEREISNATEINTEMDTIVEPVPETEVEAQYGLAAGTSAPAKVIGITEDINEGFSYVYDTKGTRIPYINLENVRVSIGKFNSVDEAYPKYRVDLDGDGSGDAYLVNNKYYKTLSCDENNCWVYDEMVYAGTFASSQEFQSKYGVDTDKNGTIDYYSVSGRYFKSYKSVGTAYYASSEIAFDKAYASFSWNRIAYDSVLKNQDGEELQVGYEVSLDDKNSDRGLKVTYGDQVYYIMTNNRISTAQRVLSKDESVTVKVRAVYYHRDSKNEKYVADSFGEWSDAYKYIFTGVKVTPAVTGVSASVSGSALTLKWNPTWIANSYNVRYIRSSTPLAITVDNFDSFYSKGNSDTLYRYASSTSNNQISFATDKAMPYWYFRVCINSSIPEYWTGFTCSNIVAFVAPTQANTPAVTGFQVETLNNGGSYQLSWNPVDAKVRIYAVEAEHVPNYFNYMLLDAWGEGEDGKYYLSSSISKVNKAEISKYVAGYISVNGMDGYCRPSLDLKSGVKYNFYIYTYDDSEYIRKNPQPAIAKNADGILGNRDDAGFDHYTAIGSGAMVSYTAMLSKPMVAVKASKTSVKLTMSGSENATGFQIYRKSGSKYKKVATITDSQYTDEDLKANTSYSYKVRAYYYNKDTKKTTYSEQVVKSVITGTSPSFFASVKKVSTTSVKLQWSKVSQAQRYEIYRSNTANEDYNNIGKQLGKGNNASAYGSSNYQLVKTIRKASTTSYTDKQLTKGDSYTYIVVAYYRVGGKLMQQTAVANIAMELETPSNVRTKVSSSKVKVTWDADKYASRYELKYTIYDQYGIAKTTIPNQVSTKKASYTINIAAGENVRVSVRAYGTNKTYSSWSEVYDASSLAAATNIKASYSSSVKAVKISWKKVNGAKYYKVYRSTRMGVYNSDEKRYQVIGSQIARQANNDSNDLYDEAEYSQYFGVMGSITGTSAYDYANLENGVTYYYYVVAYGEKDTKIQTYATVGGYRYSGSGKPASVVYGAAAPAVTLKNSAKHTVKISYKKVSGATKYEIYRAASAKGAYKKIATTKKTSYSDKKAVKGKTYYYKIKAIGTSGLKSDFYLTSGAKKVKVKK